MFVRQNQQQFRNSNADVQIFYGSSTTGNANHALKSWNKPVGISHIYMMLIGAGGTGDGTNGGGSGAVTVWYGAAQNVPDSLVVQCGGVTSGGTGLASVVSARFSNSASAPSALLQADAASSSTGASAMTANQFTASGFFQSVAGQAGSSGLITASTTTFLSGGGTSGGANPERANYGYTTTNSVASPGYFILQPIIVGIGGTDDQKGGIGCGAGVTAGATLPGPGMVLIASW